jgi:60 kDa SS-A/Ro ribonucleoprotein
MSQDYDVLTRPNTTPQNKPIRGRESEMKQNNAGGFVFCVTPWDQFRRFLITGAASGTYYVNKKDFALDNIDNIKKCIVQDGIKAVDLIVDISHRGLAAKNDPALYALALCAAADSVATRRYALANLDKVARIPTHLFTFWKYIRTMRGMGRTLIKAVRSWYLTKSPSQLAYHIAKYQQREGIAQKDMLRLAHPIPITNEHAMVFGYATDKIKYDGEKFISYVTTLDKGSEDWKKLPKDKIWIPLTAISLPNDIRILEGVEKIKYVSTAKDAAKIIAAYGLTHEMVPNEWKNHSEVWEALLPNLPLTALIRNLAKMTSIDLVAPMSDATKFIMSRLCDKDYIHKSRLHPLNILVALKTYSGGKGIKGSLEWKPVTQIKDSLEGAFYLAFENVTPSGLNTLIALDVSGSMSWGAVSGIGVLNAAEVSACMAMVTARTEPNYEIFGFASTFKDLKISKIDTLNQVLEKTRKNNFGGTDCSLPMQYALQHKIPVDTFVIYTDNETWAGHTGHPSEWIKRYRKEMDKAARLIVCATTATQVSIADPQDPGMLDIAGFGSDTPALISAFAKGEF